jgi:hypothetical protein
MPEQSPRKNSWRWIAVLIGVQSVGLVGRGERVPLVQERLAPQRQRVHLIAALARRDVPCGLRPRLGRVEPAPFAAPPAPAQLLASPHVVDPVPAGEPSAARPILQVPTLQEFAEPAVAARRGLGGRRGRLLGQRLGLLPERGDPLGGPARDVERRPALERLRHPLGHRLGGGGPEHPGEVSDPRALERQPGPEQGSRWAPIASSPLGSCSMAPARPSAIWRANG